MRLCYPGAAPFLWFAAILLCGTSPVFGSELKTLPGHVPKVVSSLVPMARLPGTNQLRLAIGLTMRDRPGLEHFVAQVSDPSSSIFRQYLTREELTSRFGPTPEDYDAVKQFALANGLAVAQTHPNRLLLDVTGPASAVEKAFHIRLWIFRHPTEARDFFAPDTEPMVDGSLPIADIEGLSDYSRPHPKWIRSSALHQGRIDPNGSAPDGSGNLFGNDFRNAYVPGTTLTGAGQSVGLLEFDGYYTNDIFTYASEAGNGRTNIVIAPVLLDGFNGKPQNSDGAAEVELDIEMSMSMAPGLAKIVSFEAGENGNQNDILNSMLANSNVLNLNCCWGWSGGPSNTTDAILESIDAVGQSFFDASGDSAAFTTGSNSVNGVDNPLLQNAPGSNPYITQVGGTTLALNGSGTSWASEVVWNWETEYGRSYNGVASSGGISSYYKIPSWQTNINMATRGGSNSLRNIPDVAANADNVYEIADDGQTSDGNGGTSCASPLWAGFMAMVNQQLAARGERSAGFINPALYAIAARSNYLSCFHDITNGNNTWSDSTKLFYATNNYDLCTGLGTMMGTNLINALTPALPAPSFLPVVRNKGSIALTWTTVAGQTYQLQYTSIVKATNWTDLGTATNASGTNATLSDSDTNAQRFYRVLLLP